MTETDIMADDLARFRTYNYACPKCDLKFPNQASLQRHTDLFCLKGGAGTRKAKIARTQRKVAVILDGPQCPDCKQHCANQASLERHRLHFCKKNFFSLEKFRQSQFDARRCRIIVNMDTVLVNVPKSKQFIALDALEHLMEQLKTLRE